MNNTLKAELRNFIERKIRIENNLKKEYKEVEFEAIDEKDETRERVARDLGTMASGAKLAYEDLLKWLDVYGGLYEDGAERELKLDGGAE